MAKIKQSLHLSFSPLFIVFGFLVVYFGWVQEFFVYLIVMLLHESAHYLTAKAYGYRLNKILFMPYGAAVSGDSNIFLPRHEIIIALAGPILNIFLVILTIAVWWLWPITYAYLQEFLKANLVLGIFNFLPLFPLDGGRVAAVFLGGSFSKPKVLKIMKISGLCVSGVCGILFICSAVFWKINLTFFFISMFLALSSFQNISDVYYERSYMKNFSQDKTKHPVEIKTFAVKSGTSVHELVKFIKGNYYTEFAILDNDNKVMKIITETEIFNLLIENKNKKEN